MKQKELCPVLNLDVGFSSGYKIFRHAEKSEVSIVFEGVDLEKMKATLGTSETAEAKAKHTVIEQFSTLRWLSISTPRRIEWPFYMPVNVCCGSTTEVSDGHENVGFRGQSGPQFQATELPNLAKMRHSRFPPKAIIASKLSPL